MTVKRAIIILVGLSIFTFASVVLRPVPRPLPQNCFEITGKVVWVGSPCCEDVVLRLAGDAHDYRINRGLERGVDVAVLRQLLEGREVTFDVIRHRWTPIDPSGRLQSLAGIRVDGLTIFSAMRPSA